MKQTSILLGIVLFAISCGVEKAGDRTLAGDNQSTDAKGDKNSGFVDVPLKFPNSAALALDGGSEPGYPGLPQEPAEPGYPGLPPYPNPNDSIRFMCDEEYVLPMEGEDVGDLPETDIGYDEIWAPRSTLFVQLESYKGNAVGTTNQWFNITGCLSPKLRLKLRDNTKYKLRLKMNLAGVQYSGQSKDTFKSGVGEITIKMKRHKSNGVTVNIEYD